MRPILGGVLTELLSWRWIFWVNLPFGGIAFLLILLFLDVHNPRTTISEGIRAVDWFGSFSILGLTVMLLLGLNFGGTTFPWDSPKVICLIIFGCLMSILFIYSERRLARYPLMPLKLLKERSNVMCLIVGFMHGAVSNRPCMIKGLQTDTHRLSLEGNIICHCIFNPSERHRQCALVYCCCHSF